MPSQEKKRKKPKEVGAPKFSRGAEIHNGWIFQRKVNEGGFGAIYAVTNKKAKVTCVKCRTDVSKIYDAKNHRCEFAMKLSLASKREMDVLMCIEIGVLRRLSASKSRNFFPKYEDTGMVNSYRYAVMELLGPSLADLQERMPNEKMTLPTTLRAVEAMHCCYYLHRDIKPGNAAIGLDEPRRIVLFDFGLARRFVEVVDKKKIRLRAARKNAPFRGTYHYCSIQQHDYFDACRRDDLWSVLYTLIELLTRVLPWDAEKDKKRIRRMKKDTPNNVLLQGCPVMFEAFMNYLDKLDYASKPSYDYFRDGLRLIYQRRGFDWDLLYDWEVGTMNDKIKKHMITTRDQAVCEGDGVTQSQRTVATRYSEDGDSESSDSSRLVQGE